MTQLTTNYDILIDVAVFKDCSALCMCMYVCTMLLTGQVHVERHLFTMLATHTEYIQGMERSSSEQLLSHSLVG